MSKTVTTKTSPLVARIGNSIVATAARASDQIKYGAEISQEQINAPKNGTWQGKMSWILDGLKNNVMDGLDALECMDIHTPLSKKREQVELSQKHSSAKQALFSSPSPIVSAVALANHLAPFMGKCIQTMNQLESAVQLHEQDTQRSRSRTQTVEKSTAAPIKKGL